MTARFRDLLRTRRPVPRRVKRGGLAFVALHFDRALEEVGHARHHLVDALDEVPRGAAVADALVHRLIDVNAIPPHASVVRHGSQRGANRVVARDLRDDLPGDLERDPNGVCIGVHVST